jgi:hypothetical protein
MSNRRPWIFGIVFWLLLPMSVGLSGRYPWLDATWFIGMVAFIAVASCVPRFVRWTLMDDEELKLWDVKRKIKR